MVLEMFEVGPCKEGYEMGFLIGHRFSALIQSRVAKDLILQHHLLPFAHSPHGQSIVQALSSFNSKRYQRYWDELLGMAQGSGVALLNILVLNFRKEILPFIPNRGKNPDTTASNDCSDLLIVNHSMAIAAHNEDANYALIGHVYLVKATLCSGLSFTAYTYAGELPSCAFGFNTHGLAFTLNSVPPSEEEIVAGGIGRNFVSRDLLEATSLNDALSRIGSSEVSVGHSYNLVDVRNRRILNVETASRKRISVHEVGERPFFHANMYLHLQVKQAHDENSLSRQTRAAEIAKSSRAEILSLLGDSENENFPVYMKGPTLYTLCTALIDIDKKTVFIFQGNPKNGDVSHMLPIS